MMMGSPLQVMNTLCLLWTVTLSCVNIEMVPSSAVFLTLIEEWGKLLKESAWVAHLDSLGKRSLVMWIALLVLQLTMLTTFVDGCSIGRCAAFWS